MPSARELLAQADALMRRNRARAVDTDIPELTEAVTELVPAPVPTALDEVPELIDAVEEIEISSIVEMPGDEYESAAWLSFDRDDTHGLPRVEDRAAGQMQSHADSEQAVQGVHSVMGAATNIPASVRAIPPVERAISGNAVAEKEMPISPPVDEEPAVADDWARWEALGREIRMQVLQRIDLFTDTGLREQLNAQLQPIIDRASAEMAATVNEEVGLLLRAYIAHAIEREIEKWRKGNA
jgi:hypothetical protein